MELLAQISLLCKTWPALCGDYVVDVVCMFTIPWFHKVWSQWECCRETSVSHTRFILLFLVVTKKSMLKTLKLAYIASLGQEPIIGMCSVGWCMSNNVVEGFQEVGVYKCAHFSNGHASFLVNTLQWQTHWSLNTSPGLASTNLHSIALLKCLSLRVYVLPVAISGLQVYIVSPDTSGGGSCAIKHFLFLEIG